MRRKKTGSRWSYEIQCHHTSSFFLLEVRKFASALGRTSALAPGVVELGQALQRAPQDFQANVVRKLRDALFEFVVSLIQQELRAFELLALLEQAITEPAHGSKDPSVLRAAVFLADVQERLQMRLRLGVATL